MGGHWRVDPEKTKSITTDGGGGETQSLCDSASPLYSDEDRKQESIAALNRGIRCIPEHALKCTGRRKRTRPDGIVIHGGTAALGTQDLPQVVCANCETRFLPGFKKCLVCGDTTRAPSVELIQEACAKARAG